MSNVAEQNNQRCEIITFLCFVWRGLRTIEALLSPHLFPHFWNERKPQWINQFLKKIRKLTKEQIYNVDDDLESTYNIKYTGLAAIGVSTNFTLRNRIKHKSI
jgi:hypothetical protein